MPSSYSGQLFPTKLEYDSDKFNLFASTYLNDFPRSVYGDPEGG
jgi:hypothetical protein